MLEDLKNRSIVGGSMGLERLVSILDREAKEGSLSSCESIFDLLGRDKEECNARFVSKYGGTWRYFFKFLFGLGGTSFRGKYQPDTASIYMLVRIHILNFSKSKTVHVLSTNDLGWTLHRPS